jgi:tetratricopeptide (TPR) repeat protein
MEFDLRDLRHDNLDSDCIWETYTELGAAAYQSGDIDIAEIMFAAARDEARRRGFSDWRLETSMRNLTSVCQARSNGNKKDTAHPQYYDPSTSPWSKIAERSTAARLRRLEELAESYAADGRYYRAANLYQQLIEFINEIFGPEHPTVVPRMLRLAWVLGMQKKHCKALEVYSRAKILSGASEGNT